MVLREERWLPKVYGKDVTNGDQDVTLLVVGCGWKRYREIETLQHVVKRRIYVYGGTTSVSSENRTEPKMRIAGADLVAVDNSAKPGSQCQPPICPHVAPASNDTRHPPPDTPAILRRCHAGLVIDNRRLGRYTYCAFMSVPPGALFY